MSVLIRNGLVVTSEGSRAADVYVDGEKIRRVGAGLSLSAEETVDATGHYVLPGVIDPHTHIDMPLMGTRTSDDWRTGSVAAACGGTTTIVDFSLQGRGESLEDAVERQKSRARGTSVVDFGIHPAVSDARPDVIREVRRAILDYGTPSLKIYLSYDFRVDDYAMIRLLEETRRHGGLLQVHAESFDMIRRMDELQAARGERSVMFHARAHAPIAEEAAVERAALATEFTGSRLYVVHLSTEVGLARIRKARGRGTRIYAETCPQYLTLSEERYQEPDWNGAKYVMAPPLRDGGSQEALWRGLSQGEVQTLGTDHCPLNFHGQKDLNGRDDYTRIPNGAPGIETLLMLLHSEGVRKGRLTLERMVEVLSTGTARLFGLKDKGSVAEGKDADLVVFDPRRRFTIGQARLHQNVDYTPWEGWDVIGMPEIVYSRGHRVAQWAGDRMEFVGQSGWGRFIRRQPPFEPCSRQ